MELLCNDGKGYRGTWLQIQSQGLSVTADGLSSDLGTIGPTWIRLGIDVEWENSRVYVLAAGTRTGPFNISDCRASEVAELNVGLATVWGLSTIVNYDNILVETDPP
jgi:hypothetical protein